MSTINITKSTWRQLSNLAINIDKLSTINNLEEKMIKKELQKLPLKEKEIMVYKYLKIINIINRENFTNYDL